jgi:hypothetical protein
MAFELLLCHAGGVALTKKNVAKAKNLDIRCKTQKSCAHRPGLAALSVG